MTGLAVGMEIPAVSTLIRAPSSIRAVDSLVNVTRARLVVNVSLSCASLKLFCFTPALAQWFTNQSSTPNLPPTSLASVPMVSKPRFSFHFSPSHDDWKAQG